MKKLLFANLLVLIFSTILFANPFLVCNPQTGITHYQLTGPAWLTTPTISAQADGSLRMDVATASTGSNSLTVAACITNSGGTQCSTFVPFVFIRPSTVTAKNIKLIK